MGELVIHCWTQGTHTYINMCCSMPWMRVSHQSLYP